MNRIVKYAAAVSVASICAVGFAGPSQARHWHHHYHYGAAAAGFAAGALLGAAVASNGYYYGPGYYYAPGPYAYEPAYQAYAYGPPAYAPSVYRGGRCWHSTSSDRGYGYWGACTPGSTPSH
jgi:hypothetical protein